MKQLICNLLARLKRWFAPVGRSRYGWEPHSLTARQKRRMLRSITHRLGGKDLVEPRMNTKRHE